MYALQQAGKFRDRQNIRQCFRNLKKNVQQSRDQVDRLKDEIRRGQLRFMLDKWQRELPNLKAERVLKDQADKAKVE